LTTESGNSLVLLSFDDQIGEDLSALQGQRLVPAPRPWRG